jgi:hypothetical protein
VLLPRRWVLSESGAIATLLKYIRILNALSAKDMLLKTLLALGLALTMPAAWASPILVEQPVALPSSEFLQTQPADVANFADDYDAQRQPADANSFDPLDRPDRSSDRLLQHSANDDDDAISAHYIAIAMYDAIFGINADLAGDLLTSYRLISRLGNDVITAIKVPFTAIGLGNDPFTQLQADTASPTILDNAEHLDDSIHRSDINRIIVLINLLFSLDYLPYYIFIFGVYVLYAVLRARHAMRQSARSGSVPPTATRSARHRDDDA